jgi:hypothetical protein
MPPQQRAQIEARWREQTAQKAKTASLQHVNQLGQAPINEDPLETDRQKQDRDRKDARLKQIMRKFNKATRNGSPST